jgi:hypothetical protein
MFQPMVGAALVSALVAAAPSDARSVHTRRLVGGPALAGDRVAWAVLTSKTLKVNAQRASARVAAIGHLRRVRGETPRVRVVGSPSLIGAEVISAVPDDDTAFRDVLAGPPTGPLTVLEHQCLPAGAHPRTIDVSGDELLYVNCADEPTVRDFGAASSAPLPATDAGLRIAGHYAAWVEGWPSKPSVVVYDRSLGQAVYAIPASAIPRGLVDLDLQADGTVAIAYTTDEGHGPTAVNRVGWASVVDPVLHRTAARAAEHYNVRIANGRIGFLRGPEGFDKPSNLAVGYVGLRSPRERVVVGRGAEDDVLEDRFDFDGNRFAWYSFGCRDTIVHVTPASSHAPGDRHCRLRLRKEPTVVKHHHVRVAVNCFGFEGGACYARRVRIARAGKGLASGRVPGAVTLTRRGRSLLRGGRRTVRVRVSAVLLDGAGRRERRATTSRLRLH